MSQNSIRVNITAANIAIVLLFGCACFHSCAKYFYFYYRLLFGTLLPAYSSYKAVKNKDVREYSRWMMYWIVFAFFSFVEVFADIFIGFWLPFYYETKILFVLWLMSPYGNGSKILYLHFIHPQLTGHEETIDTYINCAKQMGIQSVWHLWRKVAEMANRTLLYCFEFTQTLVFYQIQRNANNSMNGPQLQSQQLLSQPNLLQQFLFMRSPKPTEAPAVYQVDSPTTSHSPLPQRWFSEEALNIVEINDEFNTSHQSINLRTRSESESNLDDWEKMEINEINGKPPLKSPKPKKKGKSTKNAISERPVRRTARAAALKARAKCKEEQSFPEEY